MKACGHTHQGLKRTSNQDEIFVDLKQALFVVADGMGGHKGGGIASQLAIKSFTEAVLKPETLRSDDSKGNSTSPPEVLRRAFTKASFDVYTKATEDELHGMGTTLVGAWVVGPKLYVGHVGDSRAYLFKNNQLWQVTEDHSLENEKRRLGLPDDAMQGAKKNIITRCVGFQIDVACEIVEREWAAGDLLLLCSDGLSGAVSDDNIQSLCKQHGDDVDTLVKQAIESANAAGGMDNVSVVAIRL